MTEKLEAMLAGGQDNAALRFALGARYLAVNEPQRAAQHAGAALAQDPEYSAAWKLLGKAQAAAGRVHEAREAYRRGIDVAERKGDRQAAREMAVFLRRLENAADEPPQR